MTYSGFIQDRVSAARIMVVGCGALGNEVLKNLVLMGVRHIVAVDFDVVEIGNLSRSVLFRPSDTKAHRRKVDVVAEKLEAMNPDVEVSTVFGDICYDVGLGLIKSVDVVIGCVDSRWARYCINRLCMRAGVPWVDGGIDGLEGTARVFVPGKNCYACNLGPEGLKDLARRMPCSGIIRRQELAGAAPTTSVIASIIGAVQVEEALKLLHPEALASGELTSLCGKMFYYEGEHLTTRVAEFKAYDDSCPEHECWEPVVYTSVTSSITIEEALTSIRQELGAQNVAVSLLNDCYVDYVVERSTDHRTYVMCPGRMVEDYIDKDNALRGVPFSELYQHEYRTVDQTFPYQEKTLAQLGVPANDILHVVADDAVFYLEMKR